MRRIRLFIALLPLLLMTGCWSKVEIDEQTFVFALYIDQGDTPDKVEVTISSPLPNRLLSGQQAGSGTSHGQPYAVISKQGTSIQQALMLIQRDLTRKIHFGHTRIVTVGRQYAENGIKDMLDWMQREPTFHISTIVSTAPGKAKEVAELTPVYERMPAEVMLKMAQQRAMLDTSAKQCLIAEASGQGVATNYLTMGVMKMPSENGEIKPWAGIQGVALYYDDKLTGVLPSAEGRAIAWALGRSGRQVYTLSWDDGQSRADILFNQLMSKKSVRMGPEGPRFTLSLKGDGDLIHKRDIMNRDEKEMNAILEQKLREKIEKQLKSAFSKTQKAKSDVLQLGMLLDWKYPKFWEEKRDNWTDYYKNDLDIEFKVEINVKQVGILS
ncbi:Ger(x)C family spore germination protein [Paenibacillus chitinolyticus]|uniref:Ger(X)C family spore germination protein n=1 Tax=Paenibacillus chitinolyticus TaxID=79263 RepID=A0A410WXE7_9BACL|nr:Ger(x)C family spore germination protein [Paenibacillus chitinolyticus]MCY9589779.1 Ger(x)C family spore germination protein [Paenibacillus chitinolyticus]MCY9598220.1 Ger(x)C family spore germination protein [Paenibacillus chitinolyticus]QAV19156.1 Ger(x)C family spore germination protein [Paenibacillus chitinolyticus]